MRRMWIFVVIAVLIAGCNMPGYRQGLPGALASEAPAQTSDGGVPTASTITLTVPATEPLAPAPTVETGIIEPTSSDAFPTEQVSEPGEATVTAEPSGTEEPVSTLAAAEAPASYIVQKGTPAYMGNFVDTKAGCNWMGVAGQVFGDEGQALTEVVVEVSGELNGQPVLVLGMTGAAQALGPGGYTIKLGEQAVETQSKLSIQVRDLNGTILSAPTAFDTFSSCEKNLILINFVPENTPASVTEENQDWITHLPFVTQP